ncbi:MAG TPA: asparagine synthase (glutamine-hydrolyzing) [Caulobacteraceae bacterium]
MCGIAGIVGGARTDAEATVRSMLRRLAHRGPDDEGLWSEAEASLGHRRLAIIDLSSAGRQPMISHDGNLVLTMNGEIYNFADLRRDLETSGSIAWRGHSDTEVFLECMARYGVEAAVSRARGMFAFAVWDRRSRTAHLGRDRFGEKPLAYVADAAGLAFASEVDALAEALPHRPALSADALTAFFRLGYIPAPLTIFEGVQKLEPGSLLRWRVGEGATTAPYWSLAETIAAGRLDRFSSAAAAAEALEPAIGAAVRRQSVSDVPIGLFLSGGLDSTLIAALMAGGSPLNTFTLGFEDRRFDEAANARAIADHLGTRHCEMIATNADALAVAPELGSLYDEPFADPSQIPTVLVSRLAAREIKVCLSGDGGDEMFGGYVRYPGVERLWRTLRWLPGRRTLGRALEQAPLAQLERRLGFLGPLAERYGSRAALGPSLRRAGGWMQAPTRAALVEAAMTIWPAPGPEIAGGADPAAWRPSPPAFDEPLEGSLWRDGVDYLPGDILAKVDRAAMSVGLETRAPLLDPEVAALAWRLPMRLKIDGQTTKAIVRTLLARRLPLSLFERPKVGFTPPLHAWLTGPLRSWARDLIDPALLRRQGHLDPAIVGEAWRRLDDEGDSGAAPRIWAVLMFQSWLART